MPKQDNLLQIIKSLDTNQRRYFKLFSNLQAGEKKYVQLFELLETRKEYNTAELSTLLGVTKPQLAVMKNYLTNALLKCIRIYKEDSDPEMRLLAVANNAVELEQLGLQEFAVQMLDKAIAEAWKDERLELLPKLLGEKQRSLYSAHNFIMAAEISRECEKAAQLCSEYMHLRAVQAEICQAWLNQMPTKKYDGIVAQLEKNTIKGTFRATLEAYFIMMFYYHALKPDAGKLAKIARQGIRHYESEPHMLNLFYGNYLTMHDRLAVAEYLAGNYDKCSEVNERALLLANSAPKHVLPGFLKQFVEHRYMKRIEILLATQSYDKALKLIEELYVRIEQFSLDLKTFVLYYYAVALINLNRATEANDKLAEILPLPDGYLVAVHARVRLALVLVQLDLENYAVVPYIIRTAKAWLRRKQIDNPEIDLFFKLTYSIAKAPPYTRESRWLEFQKALENGKMPDLKSDSHLSAWLERNLARNVSKRSSKIET